MAERDEEAPDGFGLAEQGNTDAKLFVPEYSKDKNELQEEAPEVSGEGGPEGGEAA
ncbi:MAG: hypothetical protein M3433_07375 [Actinomycetota bacterium]|nr:hypothetical protein [Actinomycetota bacterium]MDQ3648389.1 hypothetical protein [Actinomycetota bacterium]